MGHQDSEHSRAHQQKLLSGAWGVGTLALSGSYTITNEGPIAHALDPNGSDRDVVLPAPNTGRFFFIANKGTANLLNIKNANLALQATVERGQSALVLSSSDGWLILGGTLGGYGANHRGGLVPDPGPTGDGTRYLREDGTWASLAGAALTDGYKYMTDGSHTATGTGSDTFKFRSAGGTILFTVTNNDATHGDNVTADVVLGAIDHNQLLNYSANRHIDHTAVTMTAGVSMSGGGDISATRTLNWDPTVPASATPALGDTFAFYSASASAVRKALLSAINAVLDHNSLLNYSANRHIDHTGVSIAAGTGMSGGGTIDATRTLNLAINTLSNDTPAVGDWIPFWDISGSDHNYMTITQLSTLINKSAAGIPMTFSITTTDSDPGTGTVRFNSGTIGSVTTWYVDNTDSGGNTITSFLDALGTNANTAGRGFVIAMVNNDPTKYQLAKVTAAVVDGTGYRKLTVTPMASGVLPSNGDVLTLFGVPSGADGAAGAAANEAFVTIGNSAGLSAERALTAGTLMSLTDGGANSTVTFSMAFGNWKTVYSDGSGVPNALTVGAAGTALCGNGVTSAPSWQTVCVAANNLSDVANAGTARTNLGLAIGTNVQAYDAQLSSVVGILSKSTAYTTVLTDGGKCIYHPSSDNNARTFTIDSNANVAYPVGTVLHFINEINTVTIAITSDTLTLTGANTTGSRSLAAGGWAVALKVASTKWVISGTGLY